MAAASRDECLAAALEVGAYKDGVFAAFVSGIRMEAHDAEHFAAHFVDGEETRMLGRQRAACSPRDRRARCARPGGAAR